MRADRLLSILMLLQTRGSITAHDLAEHLEVSERTIYRDLDALSMAGIPVYAERGPGGGYSLVDGYQTRLTGLTHAEIRALFLSTLSGAIADLGMKRSLEDALLKLSASLSSEGRTQAEQIQQRFYIDPSSTVCRERTTTLLSHIQDAIWNDMRLSLVYSCEHRARESGRKHHLVDAYGLVTKATQWYLIGACNGAIRTFRLEHILFVEQTGQHFERPPDFDLATYWKHYANSIVTGRSERKKSLVPTSRQPQRRHTTKKSHFVSQKKKIPFQHTHKKNHIKKAFALSYLSLYRSLNALASPSHTLIASICSGAIIGASSKCHRETGKQGVMNQTRTSGYRGMNGSERMFQAAVERRTLIP